LGAPPPPPTGSYLLFIIDCNNDGNRRTVFVGQTVLLILRITDSKDKHVRDMKWQGKHILKRMYIITLQISHKPIKSLNPCHFEGTSMLWPFEKLHGLRINGKICAWVKNLYSTSL